MAKKCYVGVDGVACKVKKGYVGVDGVARKIKRAYIGIGGVARPCWSGGELAYYGAITELSNKWLGGSAGAATSVGNYALFGGAQSGDTVNAYDKSLVRSIPTGLSQTRYNVGAVSIGNYALFCGGILFNNTYSTVDAYDASLTRKTATSLGLVDGGGLEGASNGAYALLSGGLNSQGDVSAYDASLTRSLPTDLGIKRWYVAAANVGDYVLFGGGNVGSGSASGAVDTYDKSLTKGTASNCYQARDLAATNVGEYALFAGGCTGSSSTSRTAYVTAYNKSLTRTYPTQLSTARFGLTGTTVEGFALFGGGTDSSGSSAVVDAYDESLTRTVQTNMSTGKQCPPATTVGNYALFGGGYQNTTVDAYVVA